MESFLWAVAPSLLVGVIMALFNRRQRHRDAQMDARSEARKRETLLALDLQMATAKLAFANAMAIKRGRPNGEIEEGVTAFEAAKKRYLEFLNEQATNHLLDKEG